MWRDGSVREMRIWDDEKGKKMLGKYSYRCQFSLEHFPVNFNEKHVDN